MGSFLTVALSWGRKVLGAIPVSFYVIALLAALLVVADVRHARLGRELIQAQQDLATLKSAGASVAHEREMAQEAARLRLNSRVAEITEAHDQDIVSIASRYDRVLATDRRVREWPQPVHSGSPSVPTGPEAPSGPVAPSSESRLVGALRNCEEGLADLEALQRFVDAQ